MNAKTISEKRGSELNKSGRGIWEDLQRGKGERL